MINRFIKKYKEYIRAGTSLIIIASYLTITPASIVDYCLRNNVEGFSNSVPWHEVYSIFTLAWVGGHTLLGVLIFCVYMMFTCRD